MPQNLKQRVLDFIEKSQRNSAKRQQKRASATPYTAGEWRTEMPRQKAPNVLSKIRRKKCARSIANLLQKQEKRSFAAWTAAQSTPAGRMRSQKNCFLKTTFWTACETAKHHGTEVRNEFRGLTPLLDLQEKRFESQLEPQLKHTCRMGKRHLSI